MKKASVMLCLPVLLITALIHPLTADADKTDTVKKLLVDLENFEAGTAEGTSLDMAGMKMHTAIRNYQSDNGNTTLDVMLIAGTNAMMQGQVPDASFESDEGNVKVQDIDGFKVANTFSKEDETGHIVINLVSKETEGAIFVVNYTGITPEKALELTKTFNWKQLKSESGKLLE